MADTSQQKRKVDSKKISKTRGIKSVSPEAVAMPTVSPLIGISIERGVFLVVSTAATDGLLSEFRLASEKPYSRVIAADSKRCQMAYSIIKDEKSGEPRRIYVAFVPTPPKAVVSGVTHGAAKHLKTTLFFNISIERFESMDRNTLRKLLFVLHEPFEKVLVSVAPETSPIRQEHQLIGAARKKQLSWKATLEQVKTHLDKKEGKKALGLLEPLVFTRNPLLEAEKLLSEILVSAAITKGNGIVGPLGSMRMESLMLSYLVKCLRTNQYSFR
jgi:hypothetical protein